MARTADVVICGAGIAGVTTAYHLAVKRGIGNVVLIDERPPLTFSSDKSTEAYRNWWPGPGDGMVRFMNRSIDLLEELALATDNTFLLNRRGYAFLTARPEQIPIYERSAVEISSLGAGPLRRHSGRPGDPPYPPHHGEGFDPELDGADLVTDPALIQEIFPFASDKTVAMLHTRRCGWLSAQQLGMYLLEEARAHGVELISGRVVKVTVRGSRVAAVTVERPNHQTEIATSTFVVAAGPFLKELGRMLGQDLPVINELHAKVSFNDVDDIVARDAPLMIWSDPVNLPWSEAERQELAAYEDTRWLAEEFPPGVHFRPEGGPGSQALLMLWTYDVAAHEVVWPPQFSPEFPEIVCRGMTRMVPGLARYFNRMGRFYVDGGYYCKTKENRPLIGPLPVEGAFVIGALSGYGIMASQASADLLTAHIAGSQLPEYAPLFLPSRYEDPAYQKLLAQMDPTTGQL